MLSDHEDIIEIPCEETINEILERYKEINEHAGSYTWKRLARPIDMEKSLEENNIIDETDEFERFNIIYNIIDLISQKMNGTFQQFIYISMMI